MSKATDLFGQGGYYEYGPIVNSFGPVVLEKTDDDYQGDTRVLYHKDNMWGYLCFGWGSCSGCDALQACDTLDEVDQLINQLESSIKWWDSAAEALKFFETHDWKGDYNFDAEFVEDAINILKGN